MLLLLLRALRQHRWFTLLGLALLFSSVGNGLTYVLVFSQLLNSHATPSWLSLAYVLALAPGLPASFAGVWLLKRWPAFSVLLLGEVFGLTGLLLPCLALWNEHPGLLLLSQAAAAFSTGLTVPALSQLFKQGLSKALIPAAAGVETLVFAANVIFGVGLGTLLYGHVSLWLMLLLDAISFIVAIGLLWYASAAFVMKAKEDSAPDESEEFSWQNVTPVQKRSLLLLPSLALVGAPVMALLPALAPALPGDNAANGLALLFARSAGQLLAPLLLSEKQVRNRAGKSFPLMLALLLFTLCYFAVGYSGTLWLAVPLIVIAHLFSNWFYLVATLNVMDSFPGPQVGAAMAATWRLQLGITLVVPLVTGTIAGYFPAQWVLPGSGICGIIIALLMLGDLRKVRNCNFISRRNHSAFNFNNDDDSKTGG
ncbi:MFS transporter [Enterobacter sp. Ap-916]|uniref:MFS transporter n=1 Tax=unclassified Enterobacter TaxID=2608935 RepID=UPI001422CC8D|nr:MULTISPECIES: MFS transporter [unclassified Enterobacter]NIF57450.1 MFS transporter [Enterobacter sp. Ap-867]NIG28608.1 MFS transporter [Enterobacter sp. Ap-916]